VLRISQLPSSPCKLHIETYIEYDIHNSNLTGVYDEEDTVVRLRTEKILVYSALAIIIIILYEYAAGVPQSNAPGGFDYSRNYRATPRQTIYTIIGLAVIVGIAYFLSKK
jgi:hypothetical protein